MKSTVPGRHNETSETSARGFVFATCQGHAPPLPDFTDAKTAKMASHAVGIGLCIFSTAWATARMTKALSRCAARVVPLRTPPKIGPPEKTDLLIDDVIGYVSALPCFCI